MIVAYLTHPIGDRDDGSQRGDNIANAMQWFKFLIGCTSWALVCPWFAYIAAVDDEWRRSRAIRDQILIMTRCDIVVAVGGWMSPHMQIEIDRAQRGLERAIPVIDLIKLGFSPPWAQSDQVGNDLARLVRGLTS